MKGIASGTKCDWLEVAGIEGARLASETRGVGQPFVWGHSLLGSMAQDLEGGVLAWRELADVAQVIRFDARGHGLSEATDAAEDYRWDRLAENLWQVADYYTDEPIVVGGASMGCATALYAAHQRPEQVKGMVLVIPPTAWASRKRMQRNYRIAAGIIKATRGLPFRLLGLVPGPGDKRSFQDNMLSVMAKHLAGVKPRGVVGAMRGAALSDLPPLPALEKLTMPTLILAWPEDPSHPLAVAEQLRDTLPNAILEVATEPRDPYQWPARVRQFLLSMSEVKVTTGVHRHG